VRVKLGPYGAKAEHDDVAQVARRSGRSFRSVARAAEDAAAALGPITEGDRGQAASGRDDSLPHSER